MSPMHRDFKIYGLAILVGSLVFLAIDRTFTLDFFYSSLLSMMAVHAAVLLGRRYL